MGGDRVVIALLAKFILCLIGLPGIIFLIFLAIGKGYNTLKSYSEDCLMIKSMTGFGRAQETIDNLILCLIGLPGILFILFFAIGKIYDALK